MFLQGYWNLELDSVHQARENSLQFKKEKKITQNFKWFFLCVWKNFSLLLPIASNLAVSYYLLWEKKSYFSNCLFSKCPLDVFDESDSVLDKGATVMNKTNSPYRAYLNCGVVQVQSSECMKKIKYFRVLCVKL